MESIEAYSRFLGKTFQQNGTKNKYTVAHLHESLGQLYITVKPNPLPAKANASYITNTVDAFFRTHTLLLQ